MVAVATRNQAPVTVDFLVVQKSMELSQGLAIFLFLGFIVATLVWWGVLARISIQSKVLQRKLKKLAEQNELMHLQLRDQPSEIKPDSNTPS